MTFAGSRGGLMAMPYVSTGGLAEAEAEAEAGAEAEAEAAGAGVGALEEHAVSARAQVRAEGIDRIGAQRNAKDPPGEGAGDCGSIRPRRV
jgi:hypothetical protein